MDYLEYINELNIKFNKEKQDFFKLLGAKPSLEKVEDIVNNNKCYMIDVICHNVKETTFNIIAEDREKAKVIAKDIVTRSLEMDDYNIESFILWVKEYDFDVDKSELKNLFDDDIITKIKEIQKDTEIFEDDLIVVYDMLEGMEILPELEYEYFFDTLEYEYRFNIFHTMNKDEQDLSVEISESLNERVDIWDDLTTNNNIIYAVDVANLVKQQEEI